MNVPKGQGQPHNPQNAAQSHYEAEEEYMKWMEGEAQAELGDHNPLAPEPGVLRTIVRLPKGKYPGSRDFWDNIPAHTASFGWTEANVTPGPTGSLQPVPQVKEKQWYNTYVYVPERRPLLERHYLERYVPGPNGEWVDTVKAERMVEFIDEKIHEHNKKRRNGAGDQERLWRPINSFC